MKHTHDDKLRLLANVVDRVIALKRDTQSSRKLVTRRARRGEVKQAHACRFDLVDQLRRGGFGIDGNVSPDFGKVGFRRIGQAEVERLANSFLPRAMMAAASNS